MHLATCLVCTAPGPPQESLVTRISLPAKPSLTRTTLGQLCVAPRTSRSRPSVTEPGGEPRVSGGTASTALDHCTIIDLYCHLALPPSTVVWLAMFL